MKKAIILCLFMVLFSAFAVSAIPDRCIFSQLNCIDFEVDYSSLSLTLLNGMGRDMTIHNIAASSYLSGGTSAEPNLNCTCKYSGDTMLKNGEKFNFVLKNSNENCPKWCNQIETGRDRNRYQFLLTYSWADSQNINHNMTGDLLATRKFTKGEITKSAIEAIIQAIAVLFLFPSILVWVVYRIVKRKNPSIRTFILLALAASLLVILFSFLYLLFLAPQNYSH
jgi:hypothetical protein